MRTIISIPREEAGRKLTFWVQHPEFPDRYYFTGVLNRWDEAPTVHLDKLEYYEDQSHVIVVNLADENGELNNG